MLKNKRILFVILMVFFMILIPNAVRAEEIIGDDPTIGVVISGIDVTLPTPFIGEKQASFSDIKVTTDGNEELEVVEVIWYKYDYETAERIEDAVLVSDIAKGFYDGAVGERFEAKEFKAGQVYSVEITYRRPWEYSYESEVEVYKNGSYAFGDFELDTANDGTCAWDKVCFPWVYPEATKYITEIDIETPIPEIGKYQYGLRDSETVKANGNENFKVMTVCWEKYNSETKEWEIESRIYSDEAKAIFGTESEETPKKFIEGEKYRVGIVYRRPWEYGYSENLVAKINGNTVDVDSSFYFHDGNPYECSEDDYAWDYVMTEFSELKKYEPADDKDKESNIDSNLGTEAEKDKEETKKEESKKEETKEEDATKAGGTIPYTGGEVVIILSAIAIIGLGIYLYRKNKDLRGI